MLQKCCFGLIILKIFTLLLAVRCQPSWERDDWFPSQNGNFLHISLNKRKHFGLLNRKILDYI